MPESGDRYPQRKHAYYALALLMLACIFSFLDRNLLSLLIPAIQRDLQVSDTQISYLQGLSFATFYSVMGMPLGWLVDRVNRRNLVAAGISLWSIATFSSGLVHSFSGLLFARMAIGIGEATLMPSAYSLLSDYFPARQRGRVFGLYTFAIFTGGGGAYIVGSAILRMFHDAPMVLVPVLGWIATWKLAFMLVGAPGLGVALLMLTAREPPRESRQGFAAQGGADAAPQSLTAYVWRQRKAYFYVWTAYSLLGYVAYGLFPWAPTFFLRHFQIPPSRSGVDFGLISMTAGIAGALIGGVLGDRWTAMHRVGAKFRLTMIWWLAAIPSTLLYTLGGTYTVAAVGLWLFLFFNAIGYVSASAVVQDMVPPTLRGRSTAFWYLITGVIGNAFGPTATALATDHIFRDKLLINYSMLSMAIPGIAIGLLVSWLGLRPYDRVCEAVSKAAQAPGAPSRSGA